MPNHLGFCDIEECESAERGEATQIQKQRTRVTRSGFSIYELMPALPINAGVLINLQ